MTPEQQPNTSPQPPQGWPAPQPGMAQPPLPQQPNAPQPWPAQQQPPAAQPWPPQQPPQAWGAPQQPPAGSQDRQGALERHHVHHSYIWLGSIQTAVMLLVVVLFSMGSAIVGAISEGDSITSSDGPVLVIVGLCVAGGLVLVVGLVALYQWVSYKHLYYELGPEEFNLYSGIFNKKRVHVPYQRIQSVDQRASLLQRVFGVCTVSIDTAGGASNKAVTVPFVQKSQAEALRRELFSRKQYQLSVQNGADPAVAAAAVAAAAGVAVPGFAPQAGSMPGAPGSMPGAPMPGGSVVPGAYPGHAPQSPGNVLDAPAELWNDVRGVFGGMHVDTGRVTYEYGMSNKELVLTGISNNTAFLLIAIGIIGAVAQVAGEVVPLLFGSFEPVVGNVVEAGSRLFGGNLIAVGVVAFLAVAAVMWVLSAIGTCISYGGFRACRRDNRIEVEHGLLQHRFQGVDVDRVQSVVVKQKLHPPPHGVLRAVARQDRRGGGKLQRAEQRPEHAWLGHPSLREASTVCRKYWRASSPNLPTCPWTTSRSRAWGCAGRSSAAASSRAPGSGWPSPWPSCRSCSTWSSMPTCRKTWPCCTSPTWPPPSATRCASCCWSWTPSAPCCGSAVRDSPTTSGSCR